MKKIVAILCVSLIAVLVAIRCMWLVSAPPGLFVDESSIGYNALTILRTGKDEHGVAFPVYFEAFGEFKNPLYIYSVAGAFALIGPSVEAIRLSAALWGIGCIGLAILFARLRDPRSSSILLFSLVLLTNPWLFSLSRVGFEVACLPFFLMAMILAFSQFTKANAPKRNVAWLVVFAVSAGLLFYSYTSGRMLAPLLFVSGLALSYRVIRWRKILMASVIFGICLLPALRWELSHPGALMARYQVVGLSGYTHGPRDFLITSVTQYAEHFSFHFLFRGGDGNLRHIASPYGVILFATLPILLLGVYAMWRRRSEPLVQWITVGLLLAPVPSALTIQSPHVLRSVGLLVYLCLICWFGIEYVTAKKVFRIRWDLLLGLLVIINASVFFRFYFFTYPNNAAIWFDADVVRVIEANTQTGGPYFLSSEMYPGTYVTIRFFDAIAQPHLGISKSRVTEFRPDAIPEKRGTYFFDGTTCEQLPSSFTSSAVLLLNDGQRCVYTR